MSRFIEVLNEHRGEVTMRTLPAHAHETLKQRLDAESAGSRCVSRTSWSSAPVSGAEG